MKIGIIVYSHTGNTFSVAQKLKEKLQAAGYSPVLEQVTATGDDQTGTGKIQLTKVPDISEYDVLLFGSPVRGFALSQVMTAYLSQLVSLEGKKIYCFVTELFPYPWMGGSRAIEQMKKICRSKGADVSETAIVNWSRSQRDKRLADTVDKLSKAVEAKS